MTPGVRARLLSFVVPRACGPLGDTIRAQCLRLAPPQFEEQRKRLAGHSPRRGATAAQPGAQHPHRQPSSERGGVSDPRGERSFAAFGRLGGEPPLQRPPCVGDVVGPCCGQNLVFPLPWGRTVFIASACMRALSTVTGVCLVVLVASGLLCIDVRHRHMLRPPCGAARPSSAPSRPVPGHPAPDERAAAAGAAHETSAALGRSPRSWPVRPGPTPHELRLRRTRRRGRAARGARSAALDSRWRGWMPRRLRGAQTQRRRDACTAHLGVAARVLVVCLSRG